MKVEITQKPQNVKVSINKSQPINVSFEKGAGARSFIGLTDTPNSYENQAGKLVQVKTDELGLEFGQNISDYVPYSGATGDVNLGFFGLTAGTLIATATGNQISPFGGTSTRTTINEQSNLTFGNRSFIGLKINESPYGAGNIQNVTGLDINIGSNGSTKRAIKTAGAISELADGVIIDDTLSLSSGSITDNTGTISFDDENLNTTGYIKANQIDVPKIKNLTTDGFIKTSNSDGTLIIDENTYLTTETDPIFTSSEAANITETDITNLGNLSGTNTGDQESSDFRLEDLSDVDKTDKAEGKILKVDSAGNHIYVDDESGTDEKVKYDVSDTTAGYLSDKIIAGDGISVSEGSGTDENKLVITNDDKGSDVDLSGLVPYTGASGDITLGDNKITAKNLKAIAPVTITVAASNSVNKESADYVCTGTSDQNTINTALNSLPATGGEVKLMEGVYTIDDSILVPSYTTLSGQGYGTHIKINAGRTSSINMIYNKNGFSGNTKIQIRGLHLDGTDAQASSTGPQMGIVLWVSTDCLIEGNYIEHLGRLGVASCIGIALVGDSNCSIVNNFIEDTVDGINSGAAGLPCKRLSITNNHVKSTNRDYGIYLININDSLVSCNQVRECYKHGIFISNSERNVVSNNFVENCGREANDTYSGIAIVGSSIENIVSNNIVKNAPSGNLQKYGLAILSTGATGLNKIYNNDLKGSGVTADYYDVGTATISAGNITSSESDYNVLGQTSLEDVDVSGLANFTGSVAINTNPDNNASGFEYGNGYNPDLGNYDNERFRVNSFFESPHLSMGVAQNYLLQTEAFDTANWVKVDIGAVSANGVQSPNGATSAEIIPAGTSDTANIYQQITNNTLGYWSAGVWARTTSGTATISLSIDTNNSPGTAKEITLDTTWRFFAVKEDIEHSHTQKIFRITTGQNEVCLWGARMNVGQTCNTYFARTTTVSTSNTQGAFFNNTPVYGSSFTGSLSGNASTSTYANYGNYFGATLSNNADKTNQWEYFGYITFTYNRTYRFGQCINTEVLLYENYFDSSVRPTDDLEIIRLNINSSMPTVANTTAFNAAIPEIKMTISGRTALTENDIAAVIYSTSTSTKVIRFYVKLKSPNTQYLISPLAPRFGMSYNASQVASASYVSFTGARNAAIAEELPTPALGDIVYPTLDWVKDKDGNVIIPAKLKDRTDRLNIQGGGVDGFFNITDTAETPQKVVQFGGAQFNVANGYPIIGWQTTAPRGGTFADESFRIDSATGNISTIGDLSAGSNFLWDTSEKKLTASANFVTVPNVESGTATQVFGFDREAYGLDYVFLVYAYKDINGTRVFSETPYTINFTDDSSAGYFSIALSWGAVTGADGYRVVVYDDYAGYFGDAYFDVTTNGTVYLIDEDFFYAPVSLVLGTPVITPTSAYGHITDLNGIVKATSFQGSGSLITGNYSIFPIVAEESGKLYSNNDGDGTGWIFSFGNGATKNHGPRMPWAGEVIAMSMSAYASGTTGARVNISINHVAQSNAYSVTSPGVANGSTENIFNTPLKFNAGDRLSFVCTNTGSSTENVVMTMWIKMQVP